MIPNVELKGDLTWPYGPPVKPTVTDLDSKKVHLEWREPIEGPPLSYRWEVRVDGSVVSTGSTLDRSVTTDRVWSEGNTLSLMVYSLYNDDKVGPIEYAEITRYSLDGQKVGVRDPLGYESCFQ